MSPDQIVEALEGRHPGEDRLLPTQSTGQYPGHDTANDHRLREKKRIHFIFHVSPLRAGRDVAVLVRWDASVGVSGVLGQRAEAVHGFVAGADLRQTSPRSVTVVHLSHSHLRRGDRTQSMAEIGEVAPTMSPQRVDANTANTARHSARLRTRQSLGRSNAPSSANGDDQDDQPVPSVAHRNPAPQRRSGAAAGSWRTAKHRQAPPSARVPCPALARLP